jgi:ferric-chelate reductase
MLPIGSIEWFAPALMDIARAAASSSRLDLHISIYVTCLCNPEAVPAIPNCDVTIVRPSVTRVLRDLTTPPPRKGTHGMYGKTAAKTEIKTIPRRSTTTAPRSSSGDESRSSADAEDADDDDIEEIDVEDLDEVDEGVLNVGTRLQWVPDGGGLAVCASGPESLVREAANAVARIQMSGRGKRLGGVGLHTEVFMV